MKRMLITGASGFLGTRIVRELAGCEEYELFALASGRRSVVFPENVNVVRANLLDRDQTKALIERLRPDIMAHLAWELSDPGYLQSAGNLVWLEESLRMLRIFIESGGNYFAFAGSSAEYARFHGFSESGDVADVSLYGQCKNSFHRTAMRLCGIGGIGYVNLRFFPILGRGMRSNVAAATAAAAFASGAKFTCRAPYNIWDFISVDDAAKAACMVMNRKYTGIVNIGSGIPRIMGDVFKAIARKMNCEHLLCLNPENKDREILIANTSVLSKIIGYECSTEFDEMLDDMIAEIQERN